MDQRHAPGIALQHRRGVMARYARPEDVQFQPHHAPLRCSPLGLPGGSCLPWGRTRRRGCGSRARYRRRGTVSPARFSSPAKRFISATPARCAAGIPPYTAYLKPRFFASAMAPTSPASLPRRSPIHANRHRLETRLPQARPDRIDARLAQLCFAVPDLLQRLERLQGLLRQHGPDSVQLHPHDLEGTAPQRRDGARRRRAKRVWLSA